MHKQSITKKTIRTIMTSCISLGLTALIIGLAIYTTTLFDQYVGHAYGIATHAEMNAKLNEASELLSKEVLRIYRSLTPKERAQTGTEAYRTYFSAIDSNPQTRQAWDTLIHILSTFMIDVDDVYIAMYDQETSALVYIADNIDEWSLYPGEWETVSRAEIEHFLNWDGSGMLYTIDKTQKYGWLATAGFPRRDAEGAIVDFIMVDISVDNIISHMASFSLKVSLGFLIITLLITWLTSHRIKKGVAEPIEAISDAAMKYVQGKKDGTEQNCFSSLNIHTGNELETLSNTMADMEKSLYAHEEHIRLITAEKERINTELNLANRIQSAMLPHVFPPFPDRNEFDLYAVMRPAREVGGDFYDFFLIDDDHLALVIADVSGKGIPGALFMMVSKIILQSCAMLGKTVGETLTKTNEALSSNNQAEMFVTVWLGVLEISTGKMTCANAGHEYPAIYHADTGSFTMLQDKHGLVIGAMPDVVYHEYEILLQKNDILFVYTDGVPEATNADQEMFGTERMINTLNQSASGSPQEILEHIEQAVDGFVGSAEQFDDMTMLCIKYTK